MQETYDYDWFKGTYLAEQSRLQQDAIATEQKLKTKNSVNFDNLSSLQKTARKQRYSYSAVLKHISELEVLIQEAVIRLQAITSYKKESFENFDDDLEQFSVAVNKVYEKAKLIELLTKMYVSENTMLDSTEIQLNWLLRDTKSIKFLLNKNLQVLLQHVPALSTSQQAKFDKALMMLNGDVNYPGAKQHYKNAVTSLLQQLNCPPVNAWKDYNTLEMVIANF